MPVMYYSSTKPSAFDTRRIAAEKWLQIKNGNGKPVVESHTIVFSSVSDESFDTPAITLGKILQTLN